MRQSIYGQSSFHAFREIEPDLAISIIRQLIELRVRRAFGVLGWYEPNSQSIEPLPMNQIFRVLNQHRSDVDFSIPFDCLVRIYGWSNIFLHIGIKESSWKHIFVTNYLKEFALGKVPSTNGWSVNSGMTVKQSILDTIINELEAAHPKNAEIIRCKPEAVLL